jgi:hypothetical protein
MAERLKAAVLKAVGRDERPGGSNPPLSAKIQGNKRSKSDMYIIRYSSDHYEEVYSTKRNGKTLSIKTPKHFFLILILTGVLI